MRFHNGKTPGKSAANFRNFLFPNWLAYWKYRGVEPGAFCMGVGVLVVDWGRGETFKGSHDILIGGNSSP